MSEDPPGAKYLGSNVEPLKINKQEPTELDLHRMYLCVLRRGQGGGGGNWKQGNEIEKHPAQCISAIILKCD